MDRVKIEKLNVVEALLEAEIQDAIETGNETELFEIYKAFLAVLVRLTGKSREEVIRNVYARTYEYLEELSDCSLALTQQNIYSAEYLLNMLVGRALKTTEAKVDLLFTEMFNLLLSVQGGTRESLLISVYEKTLAMLSQEIG